MEKQQRLKVNIQKRINEEALDIKIKDIIRDICDDYGMCYERYIKEVDSIVIGNEKQEKLLLNISSATNRDKEEIYSTMETVCLVEEESRKKELENTALTLVDNMIRNKQKTATRVEDGIDTSFLDDKKESKEERESRINKEMIENTIVSPQRSSNYMNEVRNNMLSELESSKNMLITRMEMVKGDEIKLNIAKMKFQNEMALIMNKGKIKLTEIKQDLEEKDGKLALDIEQMWEEYSKEIQEEIDDKSMEKQREKFRARISEGIHVDEQQAYKKAQEKIKEEEKELESLPENFLS